MHTLSTDAPHINSPCISCSNRRMPHQHHMHSLSAPHTHIHLHTPNIEPCGSMLKNKDLNFKALIQKTKTQSESLSPHSTMSHALTHAHLYANQNQYHQCLALIALYKSKHNPIFTKEKKIQSIAYFPPIPKKTQIMLKFKNQISIQSDLNGEMGIGRFFVIN